MDTRWPHYWWFAAGRAHTHTHTHTQREREREREVWWSKTPFVQLRSHINHVASANRAFVWWPWLLTFWPWNWCALLPARWATFLTIFMFMGFFTSRLVRRTTWHRDLDLWPWRSWRLSVIRVFVLYITVYQVWTSWASFLFGRYDTLFVTALMVLVTLTVDLLTSK